MKCFNCQGEDPGVAEGPVTQTVITHNASYQADDLDAYDSDCDDFSTTKAVLMANLSSYGSDVLSKIKLMLYDGSVIAKETSVISITDFKETLMLEEESRSKMLLNQNFGKRFVPQQKVSDDQAFRLKTSHPITDQYASPLVKIEAPRELLKVLVITTLKNDLRKFKRKDIVDNAAQVSNDTAIALGMYKLDRITLAPKDKNNRETHIYYLKHTMKQADILREIVEQAKSLNLLDSASYFACKYVKLIQELLGYVRITCPGIYKPSEKLVIVTPINKKKTVRLTATNKVPLKEPIPLEVVAQESVVTKVYTRRPK
nr:hypothetical protein [Tanacetum cinerariifolium]